MLQKYSAIKSIAGNHKGGICTIKIIPKEWLASNWTIDFATGNILSIDLIPGKDFISLNLIRESYKYNENPKSNKSGTYYDISLSGSSNDIDSPTLQALNTYRYHEWVVLFKDKKNRQRIAGNFTAGMFFEFNNAQENDGGGKQKVDIKFTIQQEDPAAFYGSLEVAIIPKLPAPYPLSITNPTPLQFLLSWPDMNYPPGTVLFLIQSKLPSGRGSSMFITISPTNFTNLQKLITVSGVGDFTYNMYAYCPGYTNSDIVSIVGNNVPVAVHLNTDYLWLDLDAEFGVNYTTVGVENQVISWTDQTTGKVFNNYIAMPLYKTDAPINGGKVISNSNNSLSVLRCLSDRLPDNITGMTIYIVASQSATNDMGGTFLKVGRNISLMRNGYASDIIAKMRYGFLPLYWFTPTINNDTFYSFRLQFDGTNQMVSVNNANTKSNVAGSELWTPDAIDIFRGNNPDSNKAIARILIFDKNHTAAEVLAVENYLKDKYDHY